MKSGDKIKFPFGKDKKQIEGTVERVFSKTVYIKADFPHHKGKILKRKINNVKV
jgi:hypothetical protein